MRRRRELAQQLGPDDVFRNCQATIDAIDRAIADEVNLVSTDPESQSPSYGALPGRHHAADEDADDDPA